MYHNVQAKVEVKPDRSSHQGSLRLIVSISKTESEKPFQTCTKFKKIIYVTAYFLHTGCNPKLQKI